MVFIQWLGGVVIDERPFTPFLSDIDDLIAGAGGAKSALSDCLAVK